MQICNSNPSVAFGASSLYTREPFKCTAGGAVEMSYNLSVSAAPSQLPWKGSQGTQVITKPPLRGRVWPVRKGASAR